jgi:hypothetical protein
VARSLVAALSSYLATDTLCCSHPTPFPKHAVPPEHSGVHNLPPFVRQSQRGIRPPPAEPAGLSRCCPRRPARRRRWRTTPVAAEQQGHGCGQGVGAVPQPPDGPAAAGSAMARRRPAPAPAHGPVASGQWMMTSPCPPVGSAPLPLGPPGPHSATGSLVTSWTSHPLRSPERGGCTTLFMYLGCKNGGSPIAHKEKHSLLRGRAFDSGTREDNTGETAYDALSWGT